MNPYNNVGKHILAECKAYKVTYKYACVNKISNATIMRHLKKIRGSGL